MSKSQNYIIVLGGTLFIIGVIIFGIVKFFIYSNLAITEQTIDFFTYVIPSIIGTAIVIIKVLNIVEKKELKEKTDLSNDYAKELKESQKKIFENQTKNIEQLARIEENISQNEANENKRNARLLEYFEKQQKKESAHKEEHLELKDTMGRIEKKFNDHIEVYHK